MNLPYSVSKSVNLSKIWLLVAAFAILTLAIAVHPWPMAAQPPVQLQVSHRSAISLAPQAVPVPVPPQRQVVEAEGGQTLRMSATPVPAAIHPVPEPVATPPSSNALP